MNSSQGDGYPKSLEAKRHFINGKAIIGIDPAKKKHQTFIIDSIGVPIGSIFKFSNSFNDFHQKLFNKLNIYIPNLSPANVVFAVEISINNLVANRFTFRR